MLPYELCARLTNASMARNRFVSVPSSKQNLAMLNVLISHGFLSSVSYQSPHVAAPRTATSSGKELVAELKFRQDRPVLNKMRLVSKPSRRVLMEADEIKRFLRGSRVRFVAGLTTGEIAFVKSDKNEEILEGREAIRRGISGEVIARAG